MIKALSSSYLNEHTVALTAALMLHAGFAAWILPSVAAPAAFKQQVIRISMVAPSSVAVEKTEVKTESTPVLASTSPATAKLQKKAEKKPLQEKKIEEAVRQAPSVPTSGLQSPDSTEKVAARTEPVFDAAYLHNPPPVYPLPARRSGVQGKVMLEVAVTAQGSAREVEVARSSGSSLLDNAAQDAVRQWRFVPAHRGDEVVEARVVVPVEFKLN